MCEIFTIFFFADWTKKTSYTSTNTSLQFWLVWFEKKPWDINFAKWLAFDWMTFSVSNPYFCFTLISQWLIVSLGWWFGILRGTLEFHKGIPGIQTTTPNQQLIISWTDKNCVFLCPLATKKDIMTTPSGVCLKGRPSTMRVRNLERRCVEPIFQGNHEDFHVLNLEDFSQPCASFFGWTYLLKKWRSQRWAAEKKRHQQDRNHCH